MFDRGRGQTLGVSCMHWITTPVYGPQPSQPRRSSFGGWAKGSKCRSLPSEPAMIGCERICVLTETGEDHDRDGSS